MFNKVKSYIRESYQEFHRVNWPTRAETFRLTMIVVGMSIGVAIFLGVLDILFKAILERYLI
jgi:preprotein translocase subunit SecE